MESNQLSEVLEVTGEDSLFYVTFDKNRFFFVLIFLIATISVLPVASVFASAERASGAYSAMREVSAAPGLVKDKNHKRRKFETNVVFNDDEAVQFEVIEKSGHQEVVAIKTKHEPGRTAL